MLRSIHISGVDNVKADRLSRCLSSRQGRLEKSVEWPVGPKVADLLLHVWESSWVDLFMTSYNSNVPVFYSWTAEPSACQGDALQAD